MVRKSAERSRIPGGWSDEDEDYDYDEDNDED
jgi:hypothetical protein